VLENYRRFIGLAGIIVNHHSPKRMGFGPVLLDPEFLGQGQTANQAHRYGQPDNKLFSHLPISVNFPGKSLFSTVAQYIYSTPARLPATTAPKKRQAKTRTLVSKS
jgi:hypothetical protein